MSRSVDLFIGSSLPIDDLAELLAKRSSAQLSPTADPGRWRFTEGAVLADLYEHSYVDDGELWLSKYRYVLSTSMSDGVGPIDSSEVLSLRHLAQLLHNPAEMPVLLVLDLQYRVKVTDRGREAGPSGPDHGSVTGSFEPAYGSAALSGPSFGSSSAEGNAADAGGHGPEGLPAGGPVGGASW